MDPVPGLESECCGGPVQVRCVPTLRATDGVFGLVVTVCGACGRCELHDLATLHDLLLDPGSVASERRTWTLGVLAAGLPVPGALRLVEHAGAQPGAFGTYARELAAYVRGRSFTASAPREWRADAPPWVRLARIAGAPMTSSAWEAALRDPDPLVAAAAVPGACSAGISAPIGVLVAIVDALAESDLLAAADRDVIDALAAELERRLPRLAAGATTVAAIRALGHVGTMSAFDELAVFGSFAWDRDTRAVARAALDKIVDRLGGAAEPQLVAKLDDGGASVEGQQQACRVLGRIGSGASLELLEELSTGFFQDPVLKREARLAVDAIRARGGRSGALSLVGGGGLSPAVEGGELSSAPEVDES